MAKSITHAGKLQIDLDLCVYGHRPRKKNHVEVLIKTTTVGLNDLPRKVVMVLAKGTLDFAKEAS